MEISDIHDGLLKKNIPTNRVFMPFVEFSLYKTYEHKESDNSFHIYKRDLCLPSFTLDSEADIKYVCKAIREVIC